MMTNAVFSSSVEASRAGGWPSAPMKLMRRPNGLNSGRGGGRKVATQHQQTRFFFDSDWMTARGIGSEYFHQRFSGDKRGGGGRRLIAAGEWRSRRAGACWGPVKCGLAGTEAHVDGVDKLLTEHFNQHPTGGEHVGVDCDYMLKVLPKLVMSAKGVGEHPNPNRRDSRRSDGSTAEDAIDWRCAGGVRSPLSSSASEEDPSSPNSATLLSLPQFNPSVPPPQLYSHPLFPEQTLSYLQPPMEIQDSIMGYSYDGLSEQMNLFYRSCRQSEKLMEQKEWLCSQLHIALKEKFGADSCLTIVGSSRSGFGAVWSDIDLHFRPPAYLVDSECSAVDLLTQAQQFLIAAINKSERKKPDGGPIRNSIVIRALVPILRMCYDDGVVNFSIDMSADKKDVAQCNSFLLYHYAKWYIFSVVKAFAKYYDINSAVNSTLSSYSLVLMVVNFLQCGVKPSVLCSLQQRFPDLFSYKAAARRIASPVAWKESMSFTVRQQNRMSLGELLQHFLYYYGFCFDYAESVVSVRMGRPIRRREVELANDQQYKSALLCIEEPYTELNTAYSVYEQRRFNAIREAFQNAYWKLSQDGDLGLIVGANATVT